MHTVMMATTYPLGLLCYAMLCCCWRPLEEGGMPEDDLWQLQHICWRCRSH